MDETRPHSGRRPKFPGQHLPHHVMIADRNPTAEHHQVSPSRRLIQPGGKAFGIIGQDRGRDHLSSHPAELPSHEDAVRLIDLPPRQQGPGRTQLIPGGDHGNTRPPHHRHLVPATGCGDTDGPRAQLQTGRQHLGARQEVLPRPPDVGFVSRLLDDPDHPARFLSQLHGNHRLGLRRQRRTRHDPHALPRRQPGIQRGSCDNHRNHPQLSPQAPVRLAERESVHGRVRKHRDSRRGSHRLSQHPRAGLSQRHPLGLGEPSHEPQ